MSHGGQILKHVAQAANLAPQQTVRMPLLMNDIQCLALMASHHGGEPQEAVEWSIETLARIVVANHRGELNAAVERQFKKANQKESETNVNPSN